MNFRIGIVFLIALALALSACGAEESVFIDRKDTMKNKLLLNLLVFSLLLSACSTAPSAPENVSVSESSTLMADLVNQGMTQSALIAAETSEVVSSIELTTEYENAASVELQLLLGTLNLEGTTLAITNEQAKTLLPLWQSYSTLVQSMLPMGQGQPGATPQPSTIGADTQIQMQELELGMPDPQQGMGGVGLTQGTPPAGEPGGGQPPSGDQALGTPPVDAGQRGGGGGIQLQLLNALIQLLEGKANS